MVYESVEDINKWPDKLFNVLKIKTHPRASLLTKCYWIDTWCETDNTPPLDTGGHGVPHLFLQKGHKSADVISQV